MADSSVQLSAELVINEAAFNRQINNLNRRPVRIQVDDRASLPLGRIAGQSRTFEKAIGAATDRVVAFGAAASAFYAVQKSIDSLVSSTVNVQNALARININLGESQRGLKAFGGQLFDVARKTGATFEETAKGAEELTRQGLGSVETLKRLSDALILSRQTGLSANDSIEALTASINSFHKEALDSTSVINRLSAVDQKFAVSSKDLAEGIARAGATAADAGVSFNELIGLITAVQQTTQRGGTVIGNSFKTFFAKLSDKTVLDNLEAIGLGVRNIGGAALPATQILENLGKAYGGLSDAQKQIVNDNVGTLFQINSLRAVLADVGDEFGVVARATAIANKATDQAIVKNAQLNSTLKASFNSLQQSTTQLLSNLGNIKIGPILEGLVKGVDNLAQNLGNSGGGQDAGKSLGEGILQGISNVITGPGLLLVLQLFAKTVLTIGRTVTAELGSLLSINNAGVAREVIQNRVNAALAKATDLEYGQFLAAKGVAEQQQVILGIVERINAELLQSSLRARSLQEALLVPSGNVLQRSLGRLGPGIRSVGAAQGLLPSISGEQAAISQGVGGAGAGARPVVIPNFAFGGGKSGTVVANTSEYMVPNFANGGSAIFNRHMIKAMGMPAGAIKLAGGFIPNFAELMGFRQGSYPIGQGQYGKVLANRKRPDLVFKEFLNKGLVQSTQANSLENEFNISKLLESAGAPVAKVFGSLSGSKRRGGLFKERVNGYRGDEVEDYVGSDISSRVIDALGDKVRGAGVTPTDLFPKNIVFNRGDIGDDLEAFARKPDKEVIDTLIKAAKIVDPGYFGLAGSGQSSGDETSYGLGRFYGSARGFIPNFLDPLGAAIARETHAGLPLSSVYVDHSPKVAGPDNPFGLLVANNRDEPHGGAQGISRVLSRGGNPKFAGLARGYVPNFALSSQTALSLGAANLRPGGVEQFIQDLDISKVNFDVQGKKIRQQILDVIGNSLNIDVRSLEGPPKAAFSKLVSEVISVRGEDIAKLTSQQIASRNAGAPQSNVGRIVTGETQKASPEALAAFEAARQASAGRTGQTATEFFNQQRGIQGFPERIFTPLKTAAVSTADQLTQASKALGKIGLLSGFSFGGNQGGDINKLKKLQIDTSQTGIQNLLKDRESQRQGRQQQLSFGLSVGASFASGLVEPTFNRLGFDTRGGTAGGRGSGAIEGALQGAGLGAIAGPEGAVFGAAIGGIVGLLGKFTKSLEETQKELDDSNAAYTRNIDAVERVIAITNQEKTLNANASPSAIRQLSQEKARAALGVTDASDRKALLGGNLSERETQDILIRNADRQIKGVAANQFKATATGINNAPLIQQAASFADSTAGKVVRGVAGLLTLGVSEVGVQGVKFGGSKGTFQDINQANDLAKSLSDLITKENIGGVTGGGQSAFIDRVSKGKNLAPEDVDRLNAALRSVGAQGIATAATLQVFADGLRKGIVISQAEQAAADDNIKRIRERARKTGFRNDFNNVPLFGESGFGANAAQNRLFKLGVGAGVSTTPDLKRANFLDFIEQFSKEAPQAADVAFDQNKGNKAFIEQQKALDRFAKSLNVAADILEKTNPEGVYRDEAGKPIQSAVFSGLKSQINLPGVTPEDQIRFGALQTELKGQQEALPPKKQAVYGPYTTYAPSGDLDYSSHISRYRSGETGQFYDSAGDNALARSLNARAYFNAHPIGKGGAVNLTGVQAPGAGVVDNDVGPDEIAAAAKITAASVKTVADAKASVDKMAEILGTQSLNINVTLSGAVKGVDNGGLTAAIQQWAQSVGLVVPKPMPPNSPSNRNYQHPVSTPVADGSDD